MENLTKENKEIIRKYYHDMYELKLNIKGIYDSKEIEKTKKFIDDKIELYLTGISNVSFNKYLSNGNHKKIRSFAFSISPTSMIYKVKEGDENSLEHVIRYYQIINELNINTNYSYVDNKEQIIEHSNAFIDEQIRNYISTNNSSNFVNYVCYVIIPSFFAKYNLNKFESKEKAYDMFYDRMIKKINCSGILTKEEKENFVMSFIKDKIDNYIKNNSDDKFKIYNYMSVVISRVSDSFKTEEGTLIEYNRYFKNRYEDTINYFYNKYKYLVKDILKEEKLDNLGNCLRYELKCKLVIKDYIDNNINGNLKFNIEKLKKGLCEFILNEEKKQSYFDYDLARNGTTEEKEEQKNILLNELCYLKDYYKEKYVYYTDSVKVKDRIDSVFECYVKAYINGNSTKNPSSYVSTRINSNLRNFKDKYEKIYIANDTEYLFARKCIPIIIKYIENNELKGNEFIEFIEYCRNAFNYYVNSGSYKEDIREFMFKVVTSYDKEISKEISYIKKHL